MLRLDVKSVNVVKPTVPCFRHDRQTPPVSGYIRRTMPDSPGDHLIPRDSHAVSVGDDYRSFEKATFVDPRSAGHFAVAVQTKHGGVHRVVKGIVPSRDDGGDASAHRALADLQFPLALDDGAVSDFHTGDVGDRVKLPGCSLEWNPEVARPNRFGCTAG